ncbi:hypothetical protein BGX27_007606 [Mortierella sp. AM989]|nr:hypothetical protein BGX27_007606 [Mortierella sp. AM989]
MFASFQDDLEGALSARLRNEMNADTLQGYVVSSGLALNIHVDQDPTPSTAGAIFRKLMGAAVRCGGADNAVWVARSLGLALDSSTIAIKGIQVVYKLLTPVESSVIINGYPATVRADALGRIERVQGALGYVFKDSQIALEAISHRSAKNTTDYNSGQPASIDDSQCLSQTSLALGPPESFQLLPQWLLEPSVEIRIPHLTTTTICHNPFRSPFPQSPIALTPYSRVISISTLL